MEQIIYKKNKNYLTISIFIIILGISLSTIGFFGRGRIREAYLNYKFQKIHDSLPPEKSAQEIVQQPSSTQPLSTASTSTTTSIKPIQKPTVLVPSSTLSLSTSTPTSSSVFSPEMNLKVPFTTQAPFRDWSMPYQEACEETAALMVHYFYEGKTFTPQIADGEIKNIVAFENQTLGFYKDTTAEQTAEFIRGFWGYSSVRVLPASLEGIKKEIMAGRPVLVPTAGRELGNPFFKQPGPIYHMLVLKGYTKDGKIITNDAGIGRGSNYVYDEDVLFKAIHDWNSEDIDKGDKLMIIIDPNK